MFDPKFLYRWLEISRLQAEHLAYTERKMMESLSPEDYKEWKREQTEERRHQELCAAIRAAGNKRRSIWYD